MNLCNARSRFRKDCKGRSAFAFLALICAIVTTGCGTTKSYTATDQLLISDAVDATISKLDFSPLTARKVYLDATYLKTVKSALLIDSDYVISSLRQQLVASGVLLVESREEAELIAEARIGALGLDGHTLTYGIPSNQALNSATAALGGTAPLPILPEVSLARREAKSGAVKIAVFAYERDTRRPYWQSGIARASSDARDTWVLGMGPFQAGSIYDAPRFAGSDLTPTLTHDETERIQDTPQFAQFVAPRIYDSQVEEADEAQQPTQVATAGAENPSTPKTR